MANTSTPQAGDSVQITTAWGSHGGVAILDRKTMWKGEVVQHWIGYDSEGQLVGRGRTAEAAAAMVLATYTD